MDIREISGDTTLERVPILEKSEMELMYCSYCTKHIDAEISHKPGKYTYLIAAILCFTCLFCFAWIPFILKQTKDRVYICPECKNAICIRSKM